MNNDSNQLSAKWHKAKIIGEILLGLGALLIPIVIQFSTIKYTNSLKDRDTAIKEREIGVHYVEIAIGILREDPNKQNTRELRKWAIDLINKNSPIQLSQSVIKDLMEKKLPPPSRVIDGGSAYAGTMSAGDTLGEVPPEHHGIGGHTFGSSPIGN